MTEPTIAGWTAQAIAARIVRYAELRPCYNAFIDCRTPGSEAKENFTIIGPGVSENPAQHVHIAEPHGFNIGGARQPPGCVNSQHSHDTAEVFVAHTGHWRFDLGEHGDDAQVTLAPGDTISIPTGMFRGFTATAPAADGTPGFLWAVLGQDDPGRVTWAPRVFEMAQEFGLVLLENGQLIDRAGGETIPDTARPMPATSAEHAATLHRPSAQDGARMVVRAGPGSRAIIGPGAPLDAPHGFTLDRIALAAGDTLADRPAEVLFVHAGELALEWDEGTVILGLGDTITVPHGLHPRYRAVHDTIAFAVRRG